jgi:DNA-directed RNA polymerase subunit H (RpoH/RPB5)
MDAELLDLISRTRPVVLEILANRGYDIAPVSDMAPEEMLKIAASQPAMLGFRVTKGDEEEGSEQHAHVLYWVEGATRLKIEGLVTKLWDTENPDVLHPDRDEVLVILAEPFHEVFDIQSIKIWSRIKARMSFFNIRNLVSNPAKHKMVPAHRKLSEEETQEVMKKYHIRNKIEFPRIIYHVDMQARVLGLIPGDIVEIRRPSPTSGEYVVYRVCSLS